MAHPWETPSAPTLAEIFALHNYRGFLKRAAGAPPATADVPMEAPGGEAPPELAPPEAAAPQAEMGLEQQPAAMPPDNSGLLRALAGMVSHDLRLQLAYLFYAETAQGVGRGELAELFRHHAEQEVADAAYFMRRISVIQPGGVLIPPPPSPEPVTDTDAMLQTLITEEERGIAYLQSLREMVGEDPMRYTIEQMLGDEQAHLDRLSQFVGKPAPAEATTVPDTTQDAPEDPSAPPAAASAPPPDAPAEPAPEPTKQSAKYDPGPGGEAFARGRGYRDYDHYADTAMAFLDGLGHKSGPLEHLTHPDGSKDSYKRTEFKTGIWPFRKAQVSYVLDEGTEKKADEVADSESMRAAANEPLESYLLRTNASTMQQQTAELAHARQELSAVREQATTATMQAEQAEATTQQLQQSLQEAQGAAQEAQMAATQAVEQATMAEESAAAQAVGKMNLSMRIQQMRQMMADMAASDPVAEEGLGFGQQAGPGSPQTATQQQMAAEQAAMMDPAAGGAPGAPQDGSGGGQGDPAAEQQGEAVRAQQEAQKQTAQAQHASGGGGGPEGTSVTVKTSPAKTAGLGDVARRAASTAGHDAGYGAVQGVGRALKELGEKHKDKLRTAAGVGGAALAGSALLKHNREERKTEALERLAGTR